MNCSKCNKLPDLPPAAIEIVNQCDPVLFHKVLRNANLGDDTAENGTPPDQLDYKNVLLVYEANNHAYLYSSDGAYTFISMGELDVDKIMEQLRQIMLDIQNLQQTDEELEAHISMLDTSLNETNANVTDNTTNIAKLGDVVDAQAQKILQNKTDIQTNQESILELQKDIGAETANRIQADEALQESIDTINTNLDQDVEQSTDFTSDTSTVIVNHTKVNLSNNTTKNTIDPLPVASEVQAGVMNTATYKAIQTNAENVDAILNGAIGLENLSATPTQAELTEAWETATGKTELINRASIYDIDNKKVWYYYENINEWTAIPINPQGEEITVSTFTNTTAGIIKGSENDGQIFAEADGTGSVVGWDGVKHDIENVVDLLETTPIPKLYDAYSSATDGANTAAFINSKLNATRVSIGSDSVVADNAVSIGTGSQATGYGIAIGYAAKSPINHGIAIGNNSRVYSTLPSLAIGDNARVGTDTNNRVNSSIALGYNSIAARDRELSIGNTSLTRYLANVTAGELDTDAVNVKQMQGYVATTLLTNIPQFISKAMVWSSPETEYTACTVKASLPLKAGSTILLYVAGDEYAITKNVYIIDKAGVAPTKPVAIQNASSSEFTFTTGTVVRITLLNDYTGENVPNGIGEYVHLGEIMTVDEFNAAWEAA